MSPQNVSGLLATALLAVALTFVSSTVSAQSRSPKTVLTVHLGTENYATNPLVDAAIREALLSRSDPAIDYFAEYLASEALPKEDASLALRDYIHRKYQSRRVDVVVATNDLALEFVLRFRRELFPDAPIVYHGMVAADATLHDAGAGLTGVLIGSGLKETLALALELHPTIERVFVVAQAPNSGLQDSMRRELGGVAQRIEIRYLTEESVPRLIAAIKAVPLRSAILYVRYSQGDPGRVLIPSDVARLVAEASPVPVYGISDSYLGSGVVGGAMHEPRAVGIRIGQIARQILDGTRPQDLPLEQAKLVPTLDWRQLQRWGISESRLPAGSTILYRQPGAWAQYRVQIVAGSLLMLLQSALIASLLIQRTRRARIERALRESEERFRLMADTAPVLVWRAGPDKLCDFFNRPWLEFTGRTMDQELGNGWAEGVSPEDLDGCLQTYVAAFDAREPFQMEYRLRRADGVYRWVLDTGVPRYGSYGSFAGYIGSGLDITDRKVSEDALRENQQRYKMATAAGAVGVWDWNFETNEIYVDPTLKSILGFEDSEITNRVEDWGSRVHPADLPAAAARVKACIEGKTDVYDIEHRMLHKDGTSKWFLSRGSAVRGMDGTLQRLVGTKVDITERKGAEMAIRENEAALHASNLEIQQLAGSLITAQDAERARIARDLHDDVSQQLAALSIALSGLKRRLGTLSDDKEVQIGVASIQQRTVALAESVRGLSHDLHPDVLKHVGLTAALVAHCADLSGSQPIEVSFTAEGDCESIDSDSALCLYRIAQEALQNVLRHSGARHAQVRLLRADDSAELTIADDGRGFDVAKTWTSRKGLGFVSINERARLAGGSLSVVTELDKGTQVRVRLPTSPGAKPAAGVLSARYAAP
jgi:PAS domain S-box-containing protein